MLTRKLGLKTGRRTVGVLGLGTAAIFMFASIVATTGMWSLIFLSLAYAGLLFQQPNLCALYLDVARTRPGAIFGFMNTAINASASVSSVAFGYLVAYSGGYQLPFIPMLVLLCVGIVLWAKVDPTQELFTERLPETDGQKNLADGAL
jgi:MFS transporter, ACS family, glucarate transporter